MKMAVLTPNGFELHETAVPAIAGDEVLIRTLACGICSGDVFVYQNRPELAATHGRLGHEASGEVVGVGRNVTAYQPGDIVTALASPAYSESFAAPAGGLVKLSPQINSTYALGEAVACCVHAANRFGTQPSDKVAVIGCGFMGLICLQLARYQGAGLICAIDPLPERREMGARFGADVTYNPFAATGAEILGQQGPFDIIIEAAGVQSAIDLSTELVAQHGRIILVGYHQSNNGLRTVNLQQWNFKAIDVVNGHVRREDEKAAAMRQGMALMALGHINTQPLVTVYDLQDIETAFRDLVNRKSGLFKAVLQIGRPPGAHTHLIHSRLIH